MLRVKAGVVFILSYILIVMPLSGYNNRALAATPLATDTRIKTFVYNESEVFPLVIYYGYTPNIEFATGEEIKVVSIGKSYAWNFTAEGRRLFLQPLEPDSHTNMTVITNRRTYQFDLQSRNPEVGLDEDLVYVVRFYYPEENIDAPKAKIESRKFVINDELDKTTKHNFNYSYTGPDSFAPVKLFDDGKRTFFVFPNNNANLPYIYYLGVDGRESRVSFVREGDYIVVDGVYSRMTLRLNWQLICVYNENM